jgi:hypothetical protein
MPVSDVYCICSAYESGVGHGVAKDGLCNPFLKESLEYEAYQYGLIQGEKMYDETTNKATNQSIKKRTIL